jgi:hypothetical protein
MAHMRGLLALSTAALLGIFAQGGCKSSHDAPEPSIPCDSNALLTAYDAFAPSDVGVYLDANDPLLAPVRADLARYLGAMWGAPVVVASTPPDGSKALAMWISTSDAARAAAGASLTDGYALARSGAKLVVYAKDAPNLAAGTYALLEELGARFFHPKEELVPKLPGPRIPRTLSVARRPAAARRGIQLHLLHPIEYGPTFLQPSAENLADAKLFIDWLVKTGQNYLQWPLLATVDFEATKAHVQAILDYAHARGVRVGAVPQTWGGSSLQNNFVLVQDPSQWQAQMDAQLARLLELPWDVVELALGEFVSTGPQSVIDWLSHATQTLLAARPSLEVFAQNHVGNYPNLYVPYQGQTVFFYHLPQFSDPRLGQDVHTLSFFDLYRNWATYKHPDFHLQHDYILKELPSRPVSYFPESAYWISADIDVPLFLPEHVYSRWNDIHTLTAEIAQKGLPPLEGHIVFSSGHEWGYWLTDYLAAKMLWEPEQPFEHFLDHYAAAFGSCSSDIATALSTFTDLQSTYLFDQRLAAYVQGENTVVDFGYLAGLETHPERVQFEDLLKMDDGQRATFETTVVHALDAFASAVQPIEDGVAARCRGSDSALAPWCDELWDGIAIVRLRARHAALVYAAALAYARGDAAASGLLDQATHVTDDAAGVVSRREAKYRFDLDRLTGEYDNPTIYAYGVLRQAHTMCYWRRREEQVRFLMENGAAEGLVALPTCAN